MRIIENSFCNNSEMSFAIAEKDDVLLVATAEKECFPLDFWSEGIVREALENGGCRVFAVVNTQTTKIIAYGVMYYCLDEGDIAKIAVVPEMRGRGLGGALLDKMLSFERENGVVNVFLEVRASNTAARGLYTSRGFEEIGIRRRYYRNPVEDAVTMARKESF